MAGDVPRGPVLEIGRVQLPDPVRREAGALGDDVGARKLAVLLHALWKSGDKYEPLRNARLRDEHVLQQATIENICVDAA